MRSLKKNQQPVYFKLYLGQEEIIDANGDKTGSFKHVYGELLKEDLCVSPNKGNSEIEMFGSLEDYDRTMTTSNTDCLIDENSILWIDGADTVEAHNYIVKRKAPWKNSIAYAVKRVTLRE